MPRPDYTNLDAAIVEAIRGGASNFSAIVAAVRPLALPLSSGEPPWTVVDRRVTAIQRKKLIRYSRTFGEGWVMRDAPADAGGVAK